MCETHNDEEKAGTSMTPKKTKPVTITQYINAAPPQSREKLREIRSFIRKSAPKATESIKWGLPAFSYQRILVMFGGFQHHVGLYPTPSALKAFARKLSSYTTSKGSIQFPLDKPLPAALIRQITAFRVKESLAQDKKWR
jgi:uncharacterized protein YdhG (YjbR/CyaY superfamily)